MAEKQKKVGADLTEGAITPLLISFAVPMILTSVIQQLYSMVDLMVIGKYVGSIGTVAVSTGGEFSDLMTPLATAFAAAGQIYIAQLVGARDKKRLHSVIGTLITLMIGVALVCTAIAALFYHQIIDILHCPEESILEAEEYMLITAVGIPFVFGYNVICAILRGMGESKRPLYFIIIAATVNIFLDLLMVVYFRMDAAGTAIATVASQIGSFVASFIFLYKRREQFGFRLSWDYLHIDTHDLKIIMRLGIPQLVRSFSVQGSMVWVKSQINLYGLVASSTYSIGNKVEKFMNLFINGIDNAGAAMEGQNLGARKPERVRQIMRQLVLISFCMSIVVAILFITIPDLFYSLFTNEIEVIEFGRTFLRIMAVGCIVVGLASPMKSIVNGSGHAGLSFVIGVLDGVMRIVVCVLFESIFHQGAQSYFWGAAFCMLVPGIISAVYYFSGKWATRKLLSEN